ncbi:AAA family ATPase [Tomitella fengzijianii]|uniref:AAA family ATPase n=1 Tax=Tomitella fengzijianii TaxID=2597660 RepID=UPI00131CBE09|nr:AAA family ATPase [Tomitella fengzijianii]
MKATYLKVENFRAHSETEIPMTQLGCLIGENNAGKSTVLHALQIALDDRKIATRDFRDVELPVTITLHLADIKDHDLERLEEKHRAKVAPMIKDGTLKIVRRQEFDEKPEALYLTAVPIDPSLSMDALNDATNNKSGKALRDAAVTLQPALAERLGEKSAKKAEVTEAWESLVSELPHDQLEERAVPLPTGIPAGIKPLFPSLIYIEAVKDASVEAKSTGTSAFAKLLNMLFEEVQGQFNDIDKQFKDVHEKLSRHFDDDGDLVDARLPAVKGIETTIENYIKLSFPGVKIRMEIPSPTLPMLLSSANLLVDDGHEGDVATKGDGLQRTVLFALLRAYTSMRATGLGDDTERADADAAAKPTHPYLLLFEEPELYLHPRAQRQLMSALESFAEDHQVLVTTHSPGFFRPKTEGFTRLHKSPIGVHATPVDLSMTLRDAYQLVRHENNEAAFFAHAVVLVEGDSDTFVFPHLAKVLSKEWDHVERNIMFVKIEGKGNITRYRRFFKHFDIDVHVITDLDALSKGFSHLTATQSVVEKHSKLMGLVTAELAFPSSLNSKGMQAITGSRSAGQLWLDAQKHFSDWKNDRSSEAAENVESVLARLFEEGRGDEKLGILKSPPSDEVKSLLDEVIADLAAEDTYVLKRGDLETYCCTNASSDKVATAINFCDETDTTEKFAAKHGDQAESVLGELRQIFASIYRAPVVPA